MPYCTTTGLNCQDSSNERQLIRRWAKEVQRSIVSCQNDQAYTEGDHYWLNGDSEDLVDLLNNHDVPEEFHDAVRRCLRCPGCGNSFDSIYDEVGVKPSWEKQQERLILTALNEYDALLRDFADFLSKFPFLGASHDAGKRILAELSGCPRYTIEPRRWYRARCPSDAKIFCSRDLGAPDPSKIRIQGGRFNHAEQSYWYLASTAEAAVCEVTTGDEGLAWVQEWNSATIPEILDLRAWKAEDLASDQLDENTDQAQKIPLITVALIFGDHIHARSDKEKLLHPEYHVPRFVADSAKVGGFKGIAFRSGRHFGENLVLFHQNANFEPIGNPRIIHMDPGLVRLRNRMYIHQGFPQSP